MMFDIIIMNLSFIPHTSSKEDIITTTPLLLFLYNNH
jgi:hypothetical protein